MLPSSIEYIQSNASCLTAPPLEPSHGEKDRQIKESWRFTPTAFDNKDPLLSPYTLSYIMAKMCMNAYTNKFQPDYTGLYDTINIIQQANTIAYLLENKDFIIVIFRGTDDLRDVLNDITFIPVDTIIGKVHKGFHDAFLSVYHQLSQKLIYTNKKLFLTGHSLGGALAIICAAYFRNKNPMLITFGSPKVGTRKFWHYVKNINHIRWANTYDIICKIPLFFCHFGEIRKLKFNLWGNGHSIRQYYKAIIKQPLVFMEFENAMQ
jgi:hypothetical protein